MDQCGVPYGARPPSDLTVEAKRSLARTSGKFAGDLFDAEHNAATGLKRG